MVCKVTANWSEKGQAVKRVAYTNVTYTPRVCVWQKKNKKQKLQKAGRLVACNQAGRNPAARLEQKIC